MSRAQIEDILELSAPERVEIAQEIWESVFEDSEALLLSPAQRAELESRWLDFQQNPEDGEFWDEVKASLRSE